MRHHDMKWNKVKLILHREIRDQLRDRRTLFMIAVLPVLLYPLMGMAMLQVSQFFRENKAKIQILGAMELPAEPALLDADGKQFLPRYCPGDNEVARRKAAQRFELTVSESVNADREATTESARRAVSSGRFDAVIVFPPKFAERLAAFQAAVKESSAGAPGGMATVEGKVPLPEVFFNTAKDRSELARRSVIGVLAAWREAVVRQTLESVQLPTASARPFNLLPVDVAEPEVKRAAVWSKILPFVLIVWALTGAFYPAIDLCAGEKERGTLETLLTSPAGRSEIVVGKLVTVMLFSMATSILNLISMVLTGAFILNQLQAAGITPPGMPTGFPPVAALAWLFLTLIPISALFGALSLSLAAMARSTKEGQYYLMPLLLATMPLVILPMSPSSELNLGSSLIPITGLMLLLRALMEGDYWTAVPYVVPCLGVTFGCCWAAVRWAVAQFNDERVLFRESERLDLGLWLVHLVRDRKETPTVATAVLCGIVLLVARFFGSMSMNVDMTWSSIVRSTLFLQLAFIATPPLLMALLFTRSPKKTLLLQWPNTASFSAAFLSLPAAFLLAVLFHPVVTALSAGVHELYPINEQTLQQLEAFQEIITNAPLWAVLALVALAPAVCEELAFRGFILSGLRHLGRKWTAIAITSVLFGIAHGVLQQSIMAAAVGMILGYIAIQTGSLLPCVLFHLTHNSMSVLLSRLTPEFVEQYTLLQVIFQPVDDGFMYSWSVVVIGGSIAVMLLLWFRGLPHQVLPEEQLQDALDHQVPRMA